MIKRAGRTTEPDRELFLVEAPTLAQVGLDLRVPSRHFVCFLACDPTGVPDEVIANAARHLLSAGCVYFCTWGPDCERVHDLVDDAIRERIPDETQDTVILTTWHARETLDEALWFSVFTACPADAYANACGAVVAIVVGNDAWSSAVMSRLNDPVRFNAEVLA